MASIPLPALDVRAPQPQQDPMESYGRLLQLKNAMQMAPLQQQALQQQVQAGQQENQMRAQQISDQQAMTKAMQQWDGKDVNQLIPLVIKNGASANAVMGLKSKVLEQQKTYSDIAASDATTGSKNLEIMKGKNDMVAGAIGTVMQMPDDQIAQGLVSTAQDMVQKGLLDPQHAQSAAQIAQSGNPAQIRQQLGLLQKSFMAQSQQMDAAAKQAQIAEAQSTAAKNNLEIKQGGPLTDQNAFVNNWLQTKGLPNTPQNRLLGQQEYIKETKIAPAEVRVQGLMQMPMQVADPNNPGETVIMSRQQALGHAGTDSASVKTPQAMSKYMTSGKGGQQLTAFNTAMQHLDVLDKLSSDLGNSNLQVFNKAAQSWAQQTGNPAPTNFEAAKNAMAGEVASALKASGATDQEISKVDGTFSRAQSPMQLKGAIATYRTLLKSKAHNLQEQYQNGVQGRPNFGGGDSNQTDPFAQFGGKAH